MNEKSIVDQFQAMKQRLILIDGHAVLFRAFHAMPGFTTPDGQPSGGIYGFVNVVLRILKELEPRWMITCFDAPGPTFRDDLYDAYKAGRAETPSDLIAQEPALKSTLDAFGIPHYALPGFEADDLIATLARQALSGPAVSEVVVATGDRDLLQLANSEIKIYLLRRGVKDIELLDGAGVQDLLGVTPQELLDWKALRGDPSDNIIGVHGVGEKTATALIQETTSIENLYRQLEEAPDSLPITPRIRTALLEAKERVFQNKVLLTLRFDAPISLDLAQADRRHYQPEVARQALAQLGFRGILERLPKLAKQETLF